MGRDEAQRAADIPTQAGRRHPCLIGPSATALDLTGPGMQGPDGAAAEVRMTAVGMADNPALDDPARWARPRKPTLRFQARYVAGLDGQASPAEPLRRQAAQVGMDRA